MYPNVKYELQLLEDLVSSALDSDQHNDVAILEQIVAELNQVRRTFIQEVFGFGDERHLERYIQYHQQAIIRIMDTIVKTLADEDIIHRPLLQGYFNGLEELLSFIEQHFSKYFDQDAKAPESYIAISRADVKSQVKRFKDELLLRHVEPEFVEAVLFALQRITELNVSEEITYRKVIYTKVMVRELDKLLVRIPNVEGNADGHFDEELRLLMYYLNYNSIRSFTYYTRHIDKLVNQKETRSEMIEQLSFELKKINQSPVKPGIKYNLSAPSLQSQLTGYLAEEIDHLERVQQLSLYPSVTHEENALLQFKVHLDISVSQLAYALKVLIETAVIKNKKVTDLFRFLTKFVVTRRTEQISYDSLRGKYYNVEMGTKAAVRTMLMEMVKYIDRTEK